MTPTASPPSPGSPIAPHHEPVMLAEAVAGVATTPAGRYVDATVGLGGHAAAILDAAGEQSRLLGIDRDPQALEIAAQRLAAYGDRVMLVHGNFADIEQLCAAHGFNAVDGVLLDLGVSSLQLEQPGRGFSFQRDEPLDMRMDPGEATTAAEIVNETPERELAALIWRYGEERRSRRIARAIVGRRPLRTTGELVGAIEQAVGRGRGRGRPQQAHPATQTFQALRIAVNRELEHLDSVLVSSHGLLDGAGARLVVISFHSLEDRAVKRYFRLHASDCICPPRTPVCICDHRATLRLITRRVRRPGEAEVARNPRARSARLRIAESIVGQAA